MFDLVSSGGLAAYSSAITQPGYLFCKPMRWRITILLALWRVLNRLAIDLILILSQVIAAEPPRLIYGKL
jgi:hypothetical protein